MAMMLLLGCEEVWEGSDLGFNRQTFLIIPERFDDRLPMPYLKAPDAMQLSQRLEGLDKDILNTRHVFEPGYAAFAVMQVATTMLADDLAGLLRETKKLVGEIDFNVNIVRKWDCEADVDPAGAAAKRD